MAEGNQYDDNCTRLREETKAEGVIMIIINGDKGTGFGVQLNPLIAPLVPQILRNIADQMDGDLKKKVEPQKP